MEAAKAAAGTGEPVRTGVRQISPPGKSVRANPARRHEFVYFQPHHSTFRVGRAGEALSPCGIQPCSIRSSQANSDHETWPVAAAGPSRYSTPHTALD